MSPELKHSIDSARRWAQSRTEECVKAKAKFDEDFGKYPAYALEYSQDLFEAGARQVVATEVMKLVTSIETMVAKPKGLVLEPEAEEILHGFIEKHRDSVLSNAMYVGTSSSQCKNLAERYQLAAWAEFIEFMKFH